MYRTPIIIGKISDKQRYSPRSGKKDTNKHHKFSSPHLCFKNVHLNCFMHGYMPLTEIVDLSRYQFIMLSYVYEWHGMATLLTVPCMFKMKT